MSALSRRSLVTSAAALPAIAVSAVAMPIVYQWTLSRIPIYAAIKKDRSLHTMPLEDELADAGVELAPAPGDSKPPK